MRCKILETRNRGQLLVDGYCTGGAYCSLFRQAVSDLSPQYFGITQRYLRTQPDSLTDGCFHIPFCKKYESRTVLV